MSRKLVAPAVCTFAYEIGIQNFSSSPAQGGEFFTGADRFRKNYL